MKKVKCLDILNKFKHTTIVTVEPENRMGYFARKETVGTILDDKIMNMLWLKREVVNISFFEDYGFIIGVR